MLGLSCASEPVALACIDEETFNEQWAQLGCHAVWECQVTYYASEEECVAGTLNESLPLFKQHLIEMCPGAKYDACEAAACLDELRHSPEECGPSPLFGTCTDFDWYQGACPSYFTTE